MKKSRDGYDRSFNAMMKRSREDVVFEFDAEKYAEERDNCALIVVKYKNFTAVINPIGLSTYLDIDIHSFVDGEHAAGSVMGMNVGYTFDGFTPDQTTHRSLRRPAANLVAVFIGEQTEA
jgi:hypothetical protein